MKAQIWPTSRLRSTRVRSFKIRNYSSVTAIIKFVKVTTSEKSRLSTEAFGEIHRFQTFGPGLEHFESCKLLARSFKGVEKVL